MVTIHYAVEGATDVPVIERVIRACGGDPRQRLVARGKPKLDPKLVGIQRSCGPHSPWVALRDLDHDAECGGALVESLLPERSSFMEFRVAVRQVEAWLLADRAAFASYFAVSAARLPRAPDECSDAKRVLVDVCSTSSKSAVRLDMTPRRGSGRKVGPGYEGMIIAFADAAWDPRRAASESPSLARAMNRIGELVARCPTH